MKNNLCSVSVVPPQSLQRLSKLAVHVEHHTDHRGQNLPRTVAMVCFHSISWLPLQPLGS